MAKLCYRIEYPDGIEHRRENMEIMDYDGLSWSVGFYKFNSLFSILKKNKKKIEEAPREKNRQPHNP